MRGRRDSKRHRHRNSGCVVRDRVVSTGSAPDSNRSRIRNPVMANTSNCLPTRRFVPKYAHSPGIVSAAPAGAQRTRRARSTLPVRSTCRCGLRTGMRRRRPLVGRGPRRGMLSALRRRPSCRSRSAHRAAAPCTARSRRRRTRPRRPPCSGSEARRPSCR